MEDVTKIESRGGRDDNDPAAVIESAGYSRREALLRGAGSAALLLGGAELLSGFGAASANAAVARAGAKKASVTLLNWHTATPNTGLGEGYIAAGKAYHGAHPNVKVAFQAEPIADYVPYVTSAFKAHSLPSNIALYPGLNHSALFPALQTLSAKEVAPLKKQLSGWLDVQRNVGSDKVYAGLPFGGQGIVWYFNKALFKKAGLDPNNPPTTFAQFQSACAKLKAAGIIPIGMSGKDSYTAWWAMAAFSTQFFTTPAAVRDFAIGKRTYNDPGLTKSLNAIVTTYKQGWWDPGFASKAFTDVESDFGAGKCAMVCGIVTDIMNWAIWDTTLGKGKYGVFAAPLLQGAQTKKPIMFFYPSILLGVSKDASDPAAALAFNKFLVSKAGQSTVLKHGGSFPNRTDVDVAGVTKSPGAAAIQGLLGKYASVDSITSWLNTSANAQAIPLLGPAILDGNVTGYQSAIAGLQAQG